MMVGSELPTPETRGGNRSPTSPTSSVDDVTVMTPNGANGSSSTTCRSPCTGRDRRHRRRRRATARANWSDAIWPRRTRRAIISVNGNDVTGCRPSSDGPPASGTSPRTGRTTASSCLHLWENAALGHQQRRPVRQGPLDRHRPDRAAPAEQIIDSFDVRTPGRRGPDFTTVGRQPAEADRRARDDDGAVDPDRLASDPWRRRRRPGADLGRPPKFARSNGLGTLLISADLEELIGLSDRLLVMLRGPGRRRPRSGNGHTGRSRFVHDRRPNGGLLMFERIWRASLAPLAATAAAIVISSIALLISGNRPGRGVQGDVADDRLDRIGRADHQPGGAVLHRRRRRGDRVQDEPVQHRLERPVHPRRADRRLGRRGGVAAAADPRCVRLPRRHHRRWHLGAHRGDPERHPQRQRRHRRRSC